MVVVAGIGNGMDVRQLKRFKNGEFSRERLGLEFSAAQFFSITI